MKNIKPEQSKLEPTKSLADKMKDATQNHHTLAEKTGVVAEMLSQKINLDAYTLYLRNLHPVYAALERDMKPNSEASRLLSPFLNKMLHRTRSIEKDLDNIYGYKTWKNLPHLEASKAYVEHINHTRLSHPAALLGHIYVRYLGDMNGGQVLERLLKNSLSLPNDAYAFYRYLAIIDLPTFRTDYRDLFDLPNLNDEAETRIIKTATTAFEFNIALSKEVISFLNP